MTKKYFLISIDTEGDNLWNWDGVSPITTENTKYLQRFQNLCNEYGFKPTYLTNFEMAMDSKYVSFAKRELSLGNCEVGMHLHAWNNPPEYSLPSRIDVKPGNPYLIEYPEKIMDEKISMITHILEQQFERKMISHRAGRWATSDLYFSLLNKYGYKFDCSVTPLISWKDNPGHSPNSMGSDYSNYPDSPYRILNTSMIELPLTVIRDHRIIHDTNASIKRKIKLFKRAKDGYGKLWLRPNGKNINDLLYIAKRVQNDRKHDYLMFMLHSSEFMPGGSPVFDTEEKVEILYRDLITLFSFLSNRFDGATLSEYTNIALNRKG